MTRPAGPAAEAFLCSRAATPPQAADKKFLDAFKKRFNVDPILYAPFTYDGANLLIEAMKKANSADPAKYLPELAKISYMGATGKIEFDQKGDRKDAEMTIFTMKTGKLEPIAIVKGDKTMTYDDVAKSPAAPPAPAPPAAPAPADAPKAAPAEAPKAAPAEEPKK